MGRSQNSIKEPVVGVIIGRFQTPYLHRAHKKVFDTVLNMHDNVIVFLGIAPIPCSPENPLNFTARRLMIEDTFRPSALLRKGKTMDILGIQDTKDDYAWSKALDNQIRSLYPIGPVVLYGGDDSFASHYHGCFPVRTIEMDEYVNISATALREASKLAVEKSKEYRIGVIAASQASWPKAYPTVDILPVRRLDNHCLLAGKGIDGRKLRLIGGFADPVRDDSYEAAALRELREETGGGMEVGNLVYFGSKKIDDWRYRSGKSKVITHIYGCDYIFGAPVPADDIERLEWKPLTEDTVSCIVDEHKPLWQLIFDKLGQ